MKNESEKRMPVDEMDYIDIPAFLKRMKRYACKYILFVIPLIICMSICLAVISRPYTKKSYVAGGTAMIGLRLSDSLSFDYTFSGLTWDRQSTLTQMNYVLNELVGSGYLAQFTKDSMGIKRYEEFNGQIYIDAAYTTNLVDIYVVSESPENAEAIRNAVFTCLPDAVFPAVGFIEMDIQELYTREESSPRAYLASPIVWAAGGVALGVLGYLGLIFLYTLRRRDVETPKDLRDLTDLPCLGSLPSLKNRTGFFKLINTKKRKDSPVMTKEYQQAFDSFRRIVAEEIRQHQIRVLLLTGCGPHTGQSAIAAKLKNEWLKMGKKVVLADSSLLKSPMTEEKVCRWLDKNLWKADLVLIDGPSCDQSADALVLADCADAMIMVIGEGASQKDEIAEMFQSVQYTNARPLGYVFNAYSTL